MPIITKDLQEWNLHRNCAAVQIGLSFSGRYQYYVKNAHVKYLEYMNTLCLKFQSRIKTLIVRGF